MYKQRKPRGRGRTLAALILLAVVCIGVVELVACRIFAPELFHQITAPVRASVAALGDLNRKAVELSRSLWVRLLPQEEEEEPPPETAPESQLASEPIVTSDIPISDPAVTDLKLSKGREVLTGGLVETVYYNQAEEPWASQPYGSDQIDRYGCGPTAMSMAVSTLTDQIVNPADMAQWATDNGYWAKGSGSYLSIVEGAAAAHGLQAVPLENRTPEAVRDALLSGRLLVALMGPGHFTQGGHFIVLRGVTLTGDLLVADPNSTERSLTAWDPQLILDELSASTAHGAPIWIISKVQPDLGDIPA